MGYKNQQSDDDQEKKCNKLIMTLYACTFIHLLRPYNMQRKLKVMYNFDQPSCVSQHTHHAYPTHFFVVVSLIVIVIDRKLWVIVLSDKLRCTKWNNCLDLTTVTHYSTSIHLVVCVSNNSSVVRDIHQPINHFLLMMMIIIFGGFKFFMEAAQFWGKA